MNVDFQPPGPGRWALDRSHFPTSATPIAQWMILESMPAGMERVFAEIGVPVRRLDAAFVNGYHYTRLRPLIGADKPPRRLPPLFVLKATTRLHPEFRRRSRRATIFLRDRPYRDVVRRWQDELRPGLRAANRAFQAVDPSALDDAELQDHIGRLLDHIRENCELHFWLHGHDIGPIARLLHACQGWGVDPHRAIEALAGASPSTSRPQTRLVRLRELVESADGPVSSLDDVRAISEEAATLLDEHLDEHGCVLATGYDLTAFTLAELPGAVLDSIRRATPVTPIDHEALAADVRADVPADRRDEFDMLLADARAVMDMRDDNGPLTVEWPCGLLRRALLVAGGRLVERGALDDLEHVFELTPDEARSMFTGGLPPAGVLAERAERRALLAASDPPDTLGPDEPAPPPEVLPASLATAVSMVQVALAYLGMEGAPSADPLVGAGIGHQSYVGRARTVGTADDAIEMLEPGDVLVVRATSPAFNAVLSIAGAVVTADGGPLSHAAVLARELGIPAVVGARGALGIPDGATIEVDPSSGSVRVLSSG